jgi:iron complex outermembrane recepter protein
MGHGFKVVALAGMLAGTGVQAQVGAQADAADDGAVVEIVVTAQKRTQSLKEVPLSVAVVSGDLLESRNLTEISQLQTATPNFSFQGGNNPRGAGLTVRGVGTNNFSSAIEGSVGIVIDGVVIGRQGAGFTDLFDIQRIEVLRGPQGTLFGKNASAGVLSIVTADPQQEWEGRVQASYGSFDERILRASVTGGITSNLAMRLSGYVTKRDGYISNRFDGRQLNDRDEWGLRGKLRWDPADNVRITLSGDYSKRDAACCIWTLRSFGANAGLRATATAAGIVPGPDNRQVNLDGAVFIRQDAFGGALQVDIEAANGITLTSITALRRWNAEDNNDADQQPLPILNLNNGNSQQRQITQELRLASPATGTLQWVAGFFLFDQDYDLTNAQRGTFGSPLPPGVVLSRQIFVENDTLNMAPFADASLYLSDRFNLFAGVRFNIEQLDTAFRRGALPGTIQLGSVVNQRARRSDDYLTWRAGAQFRPSEQVVLYASVARGFKGGGFNALQDSPVLRTVDPEIPTSYEAGIKTELMDRRLRLNIAAFRTDFRNFQAQAVAPDATGSLIFDVINAGSLRTQGIEADLDLRLPGGLTLTAGAAYTDATYTNFTGAPCFTGQTAAQGCIGAGATARQDLTGKPLALAPEFTAAGTIAYETALGQSAVKGFAQVSYAWRGGTFTALTLDPRTFQPGYGLADAQLGVRGRNNRWRLWLWGKNLGNQRFAETIFPTPLDNGGFSQFIPMTAMRQFGVSGEVRF